MILQKTKHINIAAQSMFILLFQMVQVIFLKLFQPRKKPAFPGIIVTDHNNLDIQEGIYRGIYVLKGEEISPPDDNHYLAFGIDDVIQPSENPEIYVQEVRTRCGFGFAAHPDESEKRKNKAKPIKWLDKTIKVDGVEIWNWFSDWANNYDETNIFTIAYAYFFRHNLIKGPSFETLKWWDELNQQCRRNCSCNRRGRCACSENFRIHNSS